MRSANNGYISGGVSIGTVTLIRGLAARFAKTTLAQFMSVFARYGMVRGILLNGTAAVRERVPLWLSNEYQQQRSDITWMPD